MATGGADKLVNLWRIGKPANIMVSGSSVRVLS
jgi:hypothetical protein